MKHVHYVLLMYLEEYGRPAPEVHFTEPVASLAEYENSSVSAVLKQVCRSGLARQVAAHTYQITPKGKRMLNEYKAFMEAQHNHAVLSDVQDLNSLEDKQQWRFWASVAATVLLIGTLLIALIED